MIKNLLQEQEKRAAIVYDDPHVLHGDIWSLQGEFDYVVITTNIGWKRVNGKTTGVMGRGIALQAAKRYPMTELLELIPSLSPGRVLLPPVGCGNGGLDRNCVEHEIIFPAMQVEPRLYYVQP